MPLRAVAQSRYAKRRSCRPVTPIRASAPLARRAIARPRSVAGAQQCLATHRARRDVRTRQSVHQKLHPRGRSYRAVLDCFARQARSARIAFGCRLLRRHSQTIMRVCSFLSLLLAPLAEAGACQLLPSSLVRRRRTCLLTRSSRTAARQPGSARRSAIRV